MVSMGDGVREGVWLGGLVEAVEARGGCEGVARLSRLVGLAHGYQASPLDRGQEVTRGLLPHESARVSSRHQAYEVVAPAASGVEGLAVPERVVRPSGQRPTPRRARLRCASIRSRWRRARLLCGDTVSRMPWIEVSYGIEPLGAVLPLFGVSRASENCPVADMRSAR